MLRPTMRLAVVAGAVGSLLGCDYSGDWLFANPSEIPGVLDLGEITPADIGIGEVPENTIYGEVGATGSPEAGGVTFSFRGTGGAVCLWVDPELVTWNQSIAEIGVTTEYAYPDNFFDDGDLDLFAGYSVYYTGSPGERVGSFAIQYEDSLGNPVPISLNECTIASYTANDGGHAGRGSPEFCTLQATQPGVSYTVLLESFSTPLDDDRLGYGLVLANGTCRELQEDAAGGIPEECLIMGEANDIAETVVAEDGTVVVGEPVAGSEEFERSFCGIGDKPLADYCTEEATNKDCLDPEVTCFCGDPSVSPTADAF